VQSVGFRKTTLEFEARSREAGESKYSLKKLLKFSVNALCSFSDLPLQLGVYSGLGVAFCGILLMIYTIINKIVNDVPAGYSTIIVALCFMFAVTLIVIGIIGEYISILFAEVKGRPIYIVREVVNEED
jgi:dolichol-phosphate mannosyltransferase